MYSFKNDYGEGAHPNILAALAEHNLTQKKGYCMDRHSSNAVQIIKKLVGDQDAGVHLISGGTQTNLIAISELLRHHHDSITAKTGHIQIGRAHV